jgi:hypothetical protein
MHDVWMNQGGACGQICMLTAVVVMLWLLLGDELPPAAGGLACAAGALCVCVYFAGAAGQKLEEEIGVE